MSRTEVLFWAKVEKTATCWLWKAQQTHNGYGRFWLKGKLQRAHRVSWQLHFGDIPLNQFVLHRCDTPQCVNPEHLFLGTQQDNVNDRERKGRGVRIFWGRNRTVPTAEKERR